jgi:hypothetical protein
MTVLERAQETEATSRLVIPEAIIREARRRGRRRKALSLLAVIGSIGAVVAVAVLGFRNGPAIPGASRSPLEPGGRSGLGRAPAVVVAWGDYAGVLHVGDVATRRQLRIATFPVSQSSAWPVVVDGGRLLWVDAKNGIRSLQIATGKRSVIARGTAVMASPNGGRLYVDQGTTDFLELDARTLRVTRRVSIPAGWRSNPWGANPVAGGLVLTHSGKQTVLGIWHPGSRVRPLGARLTCSASTPRRTGVTAWSPGCQGVPSTLGSARTARSPSPTPLPEAR